MNQDDFRALLANSKSTATTSKNQNVLGKGNAKGKTASKPIPTASVLSQKTTKSNEFKPRNYRLSSKPILPVAQTIERNEGAPQIKGLDMSLLAQTKRQQEIDAEKQLDSMEIEKPKPKSRNELIAQLKSKNMGKKLVVEKTDISSNDKFAPIGGSPKKKKKVTKDSNATSSTDTASATSIAATGTPVNLAIKENSPSPEPLPMPALPEVDPDDDIFGGVEEYKGVSDSDSGDSQGDSPVDKVDKPSTSGKRKYFEDDDQDMESIKRTTAPSAVTNLIKQQSQNENENEEEEKEKEEDIKALLSSKGPSIQDILAMDKAAEQEEKRQARKLKGAERKVEKEKNMSSAQKANRDFQNIQNYIKKKSTS